VIEQLGPEMFDPEYILDGREAMYRTLLESIYQKMIGGMPVEQWDTPSMPAVCRCSMSTAAVRGCTVSMLASFRALAMILVQVNAMLLPFVDERHFARWSQDEIFE
jgi:hypothetical protein